MATVKMICHLCHEKIAKIIARELRKGEKQNVYFCQRCELGMLEDDKTEADLKKFYAEEYRKKPTLTSQADPQKLFETFIPLQDNRLKILKPYFTKKTKLLEVGCSAGMFLYQVKKYVGEVAGIDFDLASAKYASEKCHCPVYITEINKTSLKPNYFDIIVAFQTLEHVKDPQQFILNLKEYLKPGGIMMIEVPNLYDALVYVYDLPNHHKFFFHAAHLWYFTEKSLTKLMSEVGFKGKVYHQQDYNILNHFHWIQEGAPDPGSFASLNPPHFPLRTETSSKIKQALEQFITKTDRDYKKILANFGITSNITFLGKLE